MRRASAVLSITHLQHPEVVADSDALCRQTKHVYIVSPLQIVLFLACRSCVCVHVCPPFHVTHDNGTALMEGQEAGPFPFSSINKPRSRT